VPLKSPVNNKFPEKSTVKSLTAPPVPKSNDLAQTKFPLMSHFSKKVLAPLPVEVKLKTPLPGSTSNVPEYFAHT